MSRTRPMSWSSIRGVRGGVSVRRGNYASASKYRRRAKYASGRSYSKKIMVLKTDGELKGVDTEVGTVIGGAVLSTTNTNGDAVVLNLIQTGNGSWNRVGKKALLQSLRLFGTINWEYYPLAPANAVQSNAVRMVVVWDKQPSSGAIPTYDTIFGTTDQSGTESTDYLDPVRYDNTGRFSVLKDCKIPFTPQAYGLPGTASELTVTVMVDEFVKLKGRETIFSGQSVPMTIADISTGALYVFFRSKYTGGDGENQIQLGNDFKARLRYTD